METNLSTPQEKELKTTFEVRLLCHKIELLTQSGHAKCIAGMLNEHISTTKNPLLTPLKLMTISASDVDSIFDTLKTIQDGSSIGLSRQETKSKRQSVIMIKEEDSDLFNSEINEFMKDINSKIKQWEKYTPSLEAYSNPDKRTKKIKGIEWKLKELMSKSEKLYNEYLKMKNSPAYQNDKKHTLKTDLMEAEIKRLDVTIALLNKEVDGLKSYEAFVVLKNDLERLTAPMNKGQDKTLVEDLLSELKEKDVKSHVIQSQHANDGKGLDEYGKQCIEIAKRHGISLGIEQKAVPKEFKELAKEYQSSNNALEKAKRILASDLNEEQKLQLLKPIIGPNIGKAKTLADVFNVIARQNKDSYDKAETFCLNNQKHGFLYTHNLAKTMHNIPILSKSEVRKTDNEILDIKKLHLSDLNKRFGDLLQDAHGSAFNMVKGQMEAIDGILKELKPDVNVNNFEDVYKELANKVQSEKATQTQEIKGAINNLSATAIEDKKAQLKALRSECVKVVRQYNLYEECKLALTAPWKRDFSSSQKIYDFIKDSKTSEEAQEKVSLLIEANKENYEKAKNKIAKIDEILNDKNLLSEPSLPKELLDDQKMVENEPRNAVKNLANNNLEQNVPEVPQQLTPRKVPEYLVSEFDLFKSHVIKSIDRKVNALNAVISDLNDSKDLSSKQTKIIKLGIEIQKYQKAKSQISACDNYTQVAYYVESSEKDKGTSRSLNRMKKKAVYSTYLTHVNESGKLQQFKDQKKHSVDLKYDNLITNLGFGAGEKDEKDKSAMPFLVGLPFYVVKNAVRLTVGLVAVIGHKVIANIAHMAGIALKGAGSKVGSLCNYMFKGYKHSTGIKKAAFGFASVIAAPIKAASLAVELCGVVLDRGVKFGVDAASSVGMIAFGVVSFNGQRIQVGAKLFGGAFIDLGNGLATDAKKSFQIPDNKKFDIKTVLDEKKQPQPFPAQHTAHLTNVEPVAKNTEAQSPPKNPQDIQPPQRSRSRSVESDPTLKRIGGTLTKQSPQQNKSNKETLHRDSNGKLQDSSPKSTEGTSWKDPGL